MGTGNSIANAAAAANADRQAQIANSTNQITSAYSSPARQAQYQQYGTNLSNYLTGQVNNQEGINARNLKFANARSGLTGGSAAVDSNSQLQRDFTNGLLKASGMAQQGVADLQQADTNSKNQLIGLAQQGGNIGAIPQQVGFTAQTNLNNAKGAFNADTLGSLFGDVAGTYQQSQYADAQRRAQQGNIYAASSPFGH